MINLFSVHRNVRNHTRMNNQSEFFTRLFYKDKHTADFETAARTSRAGSDTGQYADKRFRERRPFVGVVDSKTCTGQNRADVEEALMNAVESIFVNAVNIDSNRGCGKYNNAKVEP